LTNIYVYSNLEFLKFAKEFSWQTLKFSRKMVKNLSKWVWVAGRGLKFSMNMRCSLTNIYGIHIFNFLKFVKEFSWKTLKFSWKMVKNLSKLVWVAGRELKFSINMRCLLTNRQVRAEIWQRLIDIPIWNFLKFALEFSRKTLKFSWKNGQKFV
jgi:hypothetical protein